MTARAQARKETRHCSFPGCNNTYTGPAQQRYCTDTKCIEARKILAQKLRKPKHDDSADNLHVVKGKFPPGTILRIQCAACGPSGRCTNKFIVVYELKRNTYPKYCEHHRNAYQRERFEGKSNAQSTTE